MSRGYIFDLDGTLADSYAALTASINFARAAAALPPLDVDALHRMVGRGLRNLVRVGVPGMDEDRAISLFTEHHPSVVVSGTRLLPGARDVLTELGRRGLPVAIASNKPDRFTREIVDAFDLADTVAEIWGPDRAGAPKPDPAMLVGAAESLGLSDGGAVYVGDMTIDVEVGRAAGLPVWAVPSGGSSPEELRAAGPDVLLTDLHDLLRHDEGRTR